jgi:hypothetical protein
MPRKSVELLRCFIQSPVTENIETVLLELFAERHVDHRGVDFARFEEMTPHPALHI